MANFPLVTWQVDVPSFRIQRTGPDYDSPATTLWGFETTTTGGNAAATSLAGFLLDQIQTAGVATGSATYVYASGVSPSMSPMLYDLQLVNSLSAIVTIDFFSTAAAKVFGLSSVGGLVNLATSPSPGTVTRSTFNVDGLWMPCGVSGDVRRFTQQRAAVSSNDMSGLTTDIVNWGQVIDIEFLSSAFPAANLTRWFAGISVYANAAQRNVNDPNNTMEGMLAAAAAGRTFRIYREPAIAAGTGAGYYQAAKMPTIGRSSTVRDYASPVDEPRLWDSAGLFFRGA